MANAISCSRIVFSVALLFCPTHSLSFYSLYLVAGVTDMLDGVVARKTGTVSAFGSRLDTAADSVFVAVCLIKFIPVIELPVWLCVWIAIIGLLKGVNMISGYVIQRKLVAIHTIMNKVTGAILFVLPLTVPMINLKYSAIVVCTIATFAAIQEGHDIRTRAYNERM